MTEEASIPSTNTYYYIDPLRTYEKSKPHPTQNLIELYNLSSIANSVARVSEDGTKGVKLRKSYKAHIADLSGKHTIIPKDRTISPIVFAPDREGAPIVINKFDPNNLSHYLNFSKTPENGIPGFDASNLAIGDSSGQGSKRKQKTRIGEEGDLKRRRVDV